MGQTSSLFPWKVTGVFRILKFPKITELLKVQKSFLFFMHRPHKKDFRLGAELGIRVAVYAALIHSPHYCGLWDSRTGC